MVWRAARRSLLPLSDCASRAVNIPGSVAALILQSLEAQLRTVIVDHTAEEAQPCLSGLG